MALEHDLEIIPVINKIDLPSADPERVKKEIEDVIGLDTSNAVLASAKAGIGIEEILDSIVDYIPAPEGDENAPLQALIFDSFFDSYKGVIAHIRVMQGHIKKGMKLKLMNSGKVFEVTDVGCFKPQPVDLGYLDVGEVGFVAGSLKDVRDVRVGDTITYADKRAAAGLPRRQPDGLLRPLSGRELRLRQPQGCTREDADQRCGTRLRAGDVRRLGVRLPLRLPRPVAHGCHPGAP
jgi:GTP-binding protein LepA